MSSGEEEEPLGESLAKPGSNVAEDILRKHYNSKAASSQQVIVVLTAVLEVLRSDGTEPTPTALFAALMSSLKDRGASDAPEVTSAMCAILSTVLTHTPSSAITIKYEPVVMVLSNVIAALKAANASCKAALKCLCYVLRFLKAEQWDQCSHAYEQVLLFCVDANPKVRRLAAGGVVTVLRNLRNTPAAQVTSDSVTKLALRVFSEPAKQADKVRGLKGAEKAAAEAAVAQAAAETLYLLNGLKAIGPALGTPASAAALCEPLLGLAAARQPLISQVALEALTPLCSDSDSALAAASMAQVLGSAVTVAVDKDDLPLLLAMQRLVQDGFLRLHSLDPAACRAALPQAFHVVVAQLAAAQEGVVQGAAEALRALIRRCVDARLVQEAVHHLALQQQDDDDDDDPRKMSALESILVAVQSCLGYRFRENWSTCLGVVGTLIERLGPPAAMLMPKLLSTLGEMAALREPTSWKALSTVLGTVIQVMGPECVLSVLPLNLEVAVGGAEEEDGMEADDEEDDGWFMKAGTNMWVLPLLKQHLVGAKIQYFGQQLLPLSKNMAKAAGEAVAAKQHLEAQRATTAETVLWTTLPGFFNWASDTAASLPKIVRELGAFLKHRKDLRGVICSSLDKLITQNKAASEGAAPEAPVWFTAEVAAANMAAVTASARFFLPILFDAFVAAPVDQRGALHTTIQNFASVTDKPSLEMFFRVVIKKLMKVTTDPAGVADALLEGGATVEARRCTFMELSLLLEAGLDATGAQMLFSVARPALTDPSPHVQKKAYKMLAHLVDKRPDLAQPQLQDLVETLMASLQVCSAQAKRNRLRCLAATILVMNRAAPDASPAALQPLSPFISELVLATKEVNNKARITAFELLVSIARGMSGEDDEEVMVGADDQTLARLQALMMMVMGGLAGATGTMMSASVCALSRLLFEFSHTLIHMVPELLPTVLMLMKTQNREVVNSVLGFVKVAVMRLSAEDLHAQIPTLMEGVLVWGSDCAKTRFRSKVKVIVERIVKRCGHEAAAAHVPAEHERLVRHIKRMATRKENKKHAAETASEGGGGSAKSARTARRSEWNNNILDDDDDDGETRSVGSARTARSSPGGKVVSERGGKSSKAERRARAAAGGMQLPEQGLDLLDDSSMRKLLFHKASSSTPDFGTYDTDEDGRMIVDEKRDEREDRKRRRDESDGEEEDGRSVRSGKSAKSGRSTKTTKTTQSGKSRASSKGGASSVGGRSKVSVAKRVRVDPHSGAMYRSKKGAAGDMKKAGKMDPYAYWSFDPKMLNRRKGKAKMAFGNLDNLIGVGPSGAAKGPPARRGASKVNKRHKGK